MTAAELDGVGVSADPPHRRGGLLKRERGIRGDVTLR
jgi:hypothetical protein